MDETLIKIGATQNTHALKGELKVFIEEEYEDDFLNIDTVFLTIAGKNIPYFIESVRGGNAMIVKFEDIDTIEAAAKIAKKPIQIRATDRIPEEERIVEEISSFDYLEGYMMVDKSIGQLAVIEEVMEMPQQEMAVIQYLNQEKLVPLNDRFIVSVDDKNKIVTVDLPEGLLEL
jgi:16S rRNA processing protein RimM